MDFSFFRGLIDNKKRRKLLIGGSLLLALLVFVLFSDHGVVKRISLESEKVNMIEEIRNEQRIRDSLNQRIEELRYDTTEIERVAREKYGMVKEGEKIYYIPEDEE